MSVWTTEPLGSRTVSLDRRRVPVRKTGRRRGPFPYYGASGIVDSVDGYIFDGLHLLVAEDGENLRSRKTPVAFLADGKFWVNNHAHVLIANDQNDTRFLAYAVEAVDVSGYITGSTQPKLTQAALASIPITAPDVAEQRRIAIVLGLLDEKIESNRNVVSMASELLDATIEKVGAGLPLVPLSSLTSETKVARNPEQFGDADVDHYSLPAFDERRWPQRTAAASIMSNKLVIEQPSVLVSRLNPRFNRTWWAVPEAGVAALASTEFSCLTASSPMQLAALWLAVRDRRFREAVVSRVTGTSGSHQRIRSEDLLSIGVPDTSRLPEVVKLRTLTLLELRHARGREIERLTAVRDAVLPELLSGRLRVPELEVVA